jgi:hypothetical protein
MKDESLPWRYLEKEPTGGFFYDLPTGGDSTNIRRLTESRYLLEKQQSLGFLGSRLNRGRHHLPRLLHRHLDRVESLSDQLNRLFENLFRVFRALGKRLPMPATMRTQQATCPPR